jgi:ribose 5-phosphate isomerase A
MTQIDKLKIKAAEYAANNFIQSGMLVGLGVGSTAIHAVRKIAHLIDENQLSSITAIACSKDTEELATSLGIPLIDFKPDTKIDVTIDGADEVDPLLNLVKGGGGALTREKIVAQISRREIIVIDNSKYSKQLGTKWPIPVEVIPFGWQTQETYLKSLGAKTRLRTCETGEPFLTDQNNMIIDADFGAIPEPLFLSEQLKHRTGIVEHGLFVDMATDLIIATDEGIIHKTRER